MKKRLWKWGIIIGMITILAIGIPRIISNETEDLSSTEEKKYNNLKEISESGHLDHWTNLWCRVTKPNQMDISGTP